MCVSTCIWGRLLYPFCVCIQLHTLPRLLLHFWRLLCQWAVYVYVSPFAFKSIGYIPIFALVVPIGYMQLFYSLQHVTFRLFLCSHADDVHVSTPLFLSLYHLLSPFYPPSNWDQDIACLYSFVWKYVHASLLNKALISVTLINFTGRSYDNETDTV
jgi:hypothetical protein